MPVEANRALSSRKTKLGRKQKEHWLGMSGIWVVPGRPGASWGSPGGFLGASWGLLWGVCHFSLVAVAFGKKGARNFGRIPAHLWELWVVPGRPGASWGPPGGFLGASWGLLWGVLLGSRWGQTRGKSGLLLVSLLLEVGPGWGGIPEISSIVTKNAYRNIRMNQGIASVSSQ